MSPASSTSVGTAQPTEDRKEHLEDEIVETLLTTTSGKRLLMPELQLCVVIVF